MKEKRRKGGELKKKGDEKQEAEEEGGSDLRQDGRNENGVEGCRQKTVQKILNTVSGSDQDVYAMCV